MHGIHGQCMGKSEANAPQAPLQVCVMRCGFWHSRYKLSAGLLSIIWTCGMLGALHTRTHQAGSGAGDDMEGSVCL